MRLDHWQMIDKLIQVFSGDNEAPAEPSGSKAPITDGFLDGGTPARTIFGGAVDIERSSRRHRSVLPRIVLCCLVHGRDRSSYV